MQCRDRADFFYPANCLPGTAAIEIILRGALE